MSKPESYKSLVSVDVGIEDDIGIFGNLAYNAYIEEHDPITGKSWEMSSEYNPVDVRD